MRTANRSCKARPPETEASLWNAPTQGEGQIDQPPPPLPGDEFPPAVYRSVVLAFGWMMLVAWLAFGGARGTDLDLAVATLLCAIAFAIPAIMHRTASSRPGRPPRSARQLLRSRVEISTGSISGKEVWLQVILIPAALALAAMLIGGVFALTG